MSEPLDLQAIERLADGPADEDGYVYIERRRLRHALAIVRQQREALEKCRARMLQTGILLFVQHHIDPVLALTRDEKG